MYRQLTIQEVFEEITSILAKIEATPYHSRFDNPEIRGYRARLIELQQSLLSTAIDTEMKAGEMRAWKRDS